MSWSQKSYPEKVEAMYNFQAIVYVLFFCDATFTEASAAAKKVRKGVEASPATVATDKQPVRSSGRKKRCWCLGRRSSSTDNTASANSDEQSEDSHFAGSHDTSIKRPAGSSRDDAASSHHKVPRKLSFEASAESSVQEYARMVQEYAQIGATMSSLSTPLLAGFEAAGDQEEQLVDVKQEQEAKGGGRDQACQLASLPDELSMRVFDFLNAKDLARTWLFAKTFAAGCPFFGNGGDSVIVPTSERKLWTKEKFEVQYFVDRFKMSALLREFFKLAIEDGREQMAQFIASYFLDHAGGGIGFLYHVFVQLTSREAKDENFRRMRTLKAAACGFLRHMADWTPRRLPNALQRARTIESMPNEDLTQFLTTLTKWSHTDTPFSGIRSFPCPPDFLECPLEFLTFLFDSFLSENDSISIRMSFENLQKCTSMRSGHDFGDVYLMVTKPKGVLTQHTGRVKLNIDGDSGTLPNGTEWVRAEAGSDEVQLDGAFVVRTFWDRTGTNIIEDSVLEKLLSPRHGMDINQNEYYSTVTVHLSRGPRNRPRRGMEIAKAFLLASECRRNFVRSARSAHTRACDAGQLTNAHEISQWLHN